MLLRRLLDPEETARRRKLRARIVRRNRIKREVAQGLEPKWRRVPKQARTVHDYGWDPLVDGTAVVADQKRAERENNPLVFLLQATKHEPVETKRPGGVVAMKGVDQVASRFANRVTATPDEATVRAGVQAASVGGFKSLGPVRLKPTMSAVPARPVNERARMRWRDVLQLIMIQRHEDILKKDPSRRWRQERLGLLLFDRKKFKDASEHLVKAITLGTNKSVCWRRLAQCHWYNYDATKDWDELWDAKAAFEQALAHLDMACNPYVLYEYARVLEALGSYDSALNACASLLSTFPRFALATQVKLRFVLLQRYQFLTYGLEMDPGEKERAMTKCVDMTKLMLLDKEIVASPQYVLVLYIHVRLNELLYETTAKRGDGPGTVARSAKSSADQSTEELFKTSLALKLVTMVPGMSWRLWWMQSQTYLQWADHFQGMNENIAASDALTKALELMDVPPPSSKPMARLQQQAQPSAETSTERKIQLYMAIATNYYESNQMERAIRAMETIFQLNPYLETVRQSLSAWFPAKWRDRIELEDASQVQIARVLRGLWGRAVALSKRHKLERLLESRYRANLYHPLHRRNVVRWLKSKYAPLFATQDLASRRIQKSARVYLSYARIRRALEEQRAKEIRDLRAKYSTRKYRYNRHVRFYLAQLVPEEFDDKFRWEEKSAGLIQRWFRGERVRRVYRRRRAVIKTQTEKEWAASVRIQHAYRRYHQRSHDLGCLRADELLFETQRRLQNARQRLALQLQALYHQWKHRLVLATRNELKRLQNEKNDRLRTSSAACIQRSWRRYIAYVKNGKSVNEASLLLEQLKRGHERVMAEDEKTPREMEDSARKIQALYRGKRIRASLANITKQTVASAFSEIEAMLKVCEESHATGEVSRVQLTKLVTVGERRALFDFPVVILRPSGRVELPLAHLTSAVQHSTILHTLVLDGGNYQSPRMEAIFQAMQRSKSIRILALRGITTQAKRRQSHVDAPVPEDDDEVSSSDDDDEDECDDVAAKSMGSLSPQPMTPMKALYDVLSTKNFLLEQLLLECNDLTKKPRDGALLASIVGDYFYGRYGKLRALSAQRMQLSDENAQRFGPALSINTVLVHLNLSGNEIRDAGAVSIASDGLNANRTLLYLNLADNSIGSGGAKALFSSLKTTNRTLQTLILSNNLVMNDAVSVLFEALQLNAVVEGVDLRGNLIHQDHLDVIERTMQERVGASSEELRLFLARRRLSSLGGAGRGALSPLRRTGSKGKRVAAPLSPQKWIKAQVKSCETTSLIISPSALFKTSVLTHSAATGNPSLSGSSTKKKRKPPHDAPRRKSVVALTKLPVLVSPVKVTQRNGRR